MFAVLSVIIFLLLVASFVFMCGRSLEPLAACSAGLACVLVFILITGINKSAEENEALENTVVELYLEEKNIIDIADSSDTTVINVIKILRKNGFKIE